MAAAPPVQILYWPARTRPQLITITPPREGEAEPACLLPAQQLFPLPAGIEAHRLSIQVGSA